MTSRADINTQQRIYGTGTTDIGATTPEAHAMSSALSDITF